jgi:amidase
MPELAEHFGQHFPERANDVALTVKFMLVFGNLMRERYHGKFYAKVQAYRSVVTAKYDAALAEYDALVMPSTPMKAHRLDSQAPYSMITNTAPFDLTGHPAISVPCAKSNGLPVGMMIIGKHFDDSTPLKIASAYEQSVDWLKA